MPREPGHNGPSVFREPPPRSRLRRIVAALDAFGEPGADLYRALVANSEARFRGEMDALCAAAGRRPDWANRAVAGQLQAVESELYRLVTERPPKRVGNPGHPPLVRAVVFAVFRREHAAGGTLNRQFAATAGYLGPGIDRDHVRRLVRRIVGELATLPPDRLPAVWASICAVDEILDAAGLLPRVQRGAGAHLVGCAGPV